MTASTSVGLTLDIRQKKHEEIVKQRLKFTSNQLKVDVQLYRESTYE